MDGNSAVNARARGTRSAPVGVAVEWMRRRPVSIGFALGGALVTEQVFNYPGLGKFTFTAIGAPPCTYFSTWLPAGA